MFTECLIETVSEAAIEKYGDYSKFSRVAFEGYKNEAGVWRAIRNGRKNGSRRAVTLQDLLCVSKALETPLSELFFRIEQKLKSGWQPREDSVSDRLPPRKTNIQRVEEPSSSGIGGDIQKSLEEVRVEL